jgi:hypothetical protein
VYSRLSPEDVFMGTLPPAESRVTVVATTA